MTLRNPDATVANADLPARRQAADRRGDRGAPNVGTTCTGTGAAVAVAGASTVTLPAGRSIPANGNCTFTVDVTAAVGGTYINTSSRVRWSPATATTRAAAIATLMVVPRVVAALGKPTFSPATINAGGVAALDGDAQQPERVSRDPDRAARRRPAPGAR